MQEYSTYQRRVVGGATLLLGIAALGWGISESFARPLIEAIYAGDFLPHFGRLLRTHVANNPEHSGVAFYVDLARDFGRRLLILACVFYVLVIAITRWRPALLTEYFSEKASPLSLAVARITVFGLLFAAVDPGAVVEAAGQASEARHSPALMGWFFDHVPLGETWVRGAAWGMKGACLAALIGFWTRYAAWVAALLGVYVLGIPELLGKINHGNHLLIWFAALLGASPSGDAVSIDAALRAWRDPAPHTDDGKPTSVAYGRPLRWAWLLIGVIYFFPGVWKFLLGGSEWMLSENLKFKMYAKWHQLHFIPSLRIDLVPALYKGLAVLTVLFEVGFIVAVLFRKWRPLLVLGGLGFHLGIAYWMRIVFWNLIACYTLFVPWGRFAEWVGRHLFNQPLLVQYAPNDPSAARVAAVLRAFDWLRGLECVPATDAEPDRIRVRGGEDEYKGWGGLLRALVRVPLAAPLFPFLIAAFAWRRPAAGAPNRTGGESTATMVAEDHQLGRLGTLVGGVLLSVNVAFGLFLINSWPFSVYPTHAGVSGPYITDVRIQAVTAEKETTSVGPLLDLSPTRRRGMARTLLAASDTSEQRRQTCRAARLVANRHPRSARVTEVRFQRVRISKVPSQWEQNPIGQSLMAAVPISDGASSSPICGEIILKPGEDEPLPPRNSRDLNSRK
jgi:hypothetical protein